jgi:hypothetical protein
MKEITVTIGKDGTIVTTSSGIKGTECTDIHNALAKALGETVNQNETPEIYEHEQEHNTTAR